MRQSLCSQLNCQDATEYETAEAQKTQRLAEKT